MVDVSIPLSELETLNESLKKIIVEFTDASAKQDDVVAAIATPLGRHELNRKCDDFEHGWNDRRDKLTKDLTTVQERVQATVEGWQKTDKDVAASMEAK